MNSDSNKSQYDKMLNTHIPRLIINLSIPTVISMMVSNVYNVVDTAFVGKLGTSDSGAVGIVFGFMSILQAIGFTFGQGAGSLISRSLGNKDGEQASDFASTAFFFSFIVAIAVSLFCFFEIDSIIYALGSTNTIAPYAKTYITYILITAPFMVSSFTLNSVLRYEGKAFFGMIGLMSGAIINIAGDALFMFGLNMGIAGAGLSTAISQVISFILLLFPFYKGHTQCKLLPANVRFTKEVLDIVTLGLPSLLRQGLGSISTIVLNSQAAIYGDYAVAGMSIVSRIFFFIFSFAIGVGQGFQPVCGYCYGAKRYDRVRDAFKFSLKLGELMMVVLGVVGYVWAPVWVTLLRNDPMVIEVAVRSLRLHLLAALLMPLCMITEMMMQCTGQKWRASFLSALRNGIIFIPVLVILAKIRGLAGIQEAEPLAFVISFFPSLLFARCFFKKLQKNS